MANSWLSACDYFIGSSKCRDHCWRIFDRNVEGIITVVRNSGVRIEEQQKSIAIWIVINRYLSFVLYSFNWKHHIHLNMLNDI